MFYLQPTLQCLRKCHHDIRFQLDMYMTGLCRLINGLQGQNIEEDKTLNIRIIENRKEIGMFQFIVTESVYALRSLQYTESMNFRIILYLIHKTSIHIFEGLQIYETQKYFLYKLRPYRPLTVKMTLSQLLFYNKEKKYYSACETVVRFSFENLSCLAAL